jgi:streptogramin lyase
MRPHDRAPLHSIPARWCFSLSVLTVLAMGCGDTGSGDATRPPNEGAGASAGGMPGAGSGVGGAQAGSTDSSGGALTGTGGGSAGSTNGNASGGPSNGGNGGTSSRVVGSGVTGTANAPSITFTEYPIPTSSNPGAIAAGPDGNLWFNHQSTAPAAIQSVSPTGKFSAVFATEAARTGPIGVTGGPDGNVWFTKQSGIGRVTPTGAVTIFPVPNSGDSGGIVKGPDGKLWFTEPLKNKVTSITQAAEFTEYPIPTANSGPLGIAAGPDGNLWFTEAATAGNKIARITPAGVISEYALPTAGSNAQSVVAGPDGNIWFTELDAHQIGRVTPTGTVTEFPIPSGAGPGSITAGKDGNLWFVEAGSANAIGRVTPAGSVAEYAVPTSGSDPSGIAPGSDGNIWFTELSANKVTRISDLNGGGNVGSSTGVGGSGELSDGKTCTDDTDCPESGKACGGDVCNVKVTPHICVLAVEGNLGQCSDDSKCWCVGEGATCNTTSHACSFTTHDGGSASKGGAGP